MSPPRSSRALASLIAIILACGAIPRVGHGGLLTITHSIPTQFASNFSNEINLASGTDNLDWGILVDTGNNGFLPGFYTSFNTTTNQFLSTLSGATDDYWVPSIQATFTANVALPDGGSPGTINQIVGVPVYDPSNPSYVIQVNNLYGLMWFSLPTYGTNRTTTGTDVVADIGDKYGFLADASLKITANSGAITNSAMFAGADPVRNTGAENGPPLNTGYSVIPEPSLVVLLLSAFLGLAVAARMRRRPALSA